jgi:prophage antirepressor-like protein
MDLVKVFVENEATSSINIQGTWEKPLFNARDIGTLLGLVNIHASLEALPKKEKVDVDVKTPGGVQKMIFLTEAGLYRVLFNSRKPIAETFRQWVFDVIHEIRVTGRYELEEAVKRSTGKIAELEIRLLTSLEDQQRSSALERQVMLIEAFDHRRVVYVAIIKTLEDGYVVKVGHSFDIKTRMEKHRSTYGNDTVLVFVFEAFKNVELENFLFHVRAFRQNRYTEAVNGKVSEEHFFVQKQGLFTLDIVFEIIKQEGQAFKHHDTAVYLRQQEANNQVNQLQLGRDQLDFQLQTERKRLELEEARLQFERDKLEFERTAAQSTQPRTICQSDQLSTERLADILAQRVIATLPETVGKQLVVALPGALQQAGLANIAAAGKAAEASADTCTVPKRAIESRVSAGPFVQKLDPHTLDVIAWYDGVTEAMRREAETDGSISAPALKRAVEKASVYKNFRWFLVARDKDPSAKQEGVPPTSDNAQYVAHGWVAQMNHHKTEIIAVYLDQKTAAEANGFKSRATISTAVKKGGPRGRCYYALWKNCPEALRSAYVNKNGEPDFPLPVHIQAFDIEGRLVGSYSTQQEIVTKLAIGHNKIREMLQTGKVYRDRILKRCDPPSADSESEDESSEEEDEV